LEAKQAVLLSINFLSDHVEDSLEESLEVIFGALNATFSWRTLNKVIETMHLFLVGWASPPRHRLSYEYFGRGRAGKGAIKEAVRCDL